jgi:hypothetical protein
MSPDDNDSRPLADTLRSRGANPDPLSMFDSEGPDLATPPAANQDLPYESEDPVREVRQRLLAGNFEGASPRPIPGRLGALKIRFSETAADIQSRVTSRIRNYIVQHPKLLVPMASIACVLIIAFVAGLAVPEVVVLAPMPSSSAKIAPNRPDVVQPNDRAAASVTSTVTNGHPARVDTVEAQRRASDPTQGRATAAKSGVTVQRAAVDVRSMPSRRTPAAESSEPVPVRPPASIPTAQNVAASAAALSSNTNPPAVLTAQHPDSLSSDPAPVPRATDPDSLSSRSTPVLSTPDPYASEVYSREDPSVRPPQMIDIDLPRPAIANWTTIRNSMEVIITENGSVERVKWLRSGGGRMPDVMLLSRAKLWKFAPAVKDGHAVRYKLVISWDVNP